LKPKELPLQTLRRTGFEPVSEKNDLIRFLLSSFPDALAIYQFGSFGTAGAHPASDLDLALLPTAPLDSDVATSGDHFVGDE
jgi:hypothetical protein